MSRNLITAWLAALIMATAVTGTAQAQRIQPLIDPAYFQPDFQYFAPPELTEYGGEPQPNTGWFAGYDRVVMYVSRPQSEQSYTEGDFTWGNRFEIGYMTEQNHGWSFGLLHIDGPNADDGYQIERLNRYNEDNPAGPGTGTGGGGGGGGGGTTAQVPYYPAADRNDGFTDQRTYFLHNSTNLADLMAFELNKTFRLEPLHNGGILEPFFGVRYNKFTDWTMRDTYTRYDDEGNVIPTLPNPDFALDDATIEDYQRYTWSIVNQMVGGQVGIRWHRQLSRWTLDSEFRAFAMQNFQSMKYWNAGETTQYDGAGTGSEVTLNLYNKSTSYDHDSEFVFGCDVRAQAAFQFTRDISARCGMHLIDYGTGIGRGNNFTQNSQDLLLVGFTFGVTVNR